MSKDTINLIAALSREWGGGLAQEHPKRPCICQRVPGLTCKQAGADCANPRQ